MRDSLITTTNPSIERTMRMAVPGRAVSRLRILSAFGLVCGLLGTTALAGQQPIEGVLVSLDGKRRIAVTFLEAGRGPLPKNMRGLALWAEEGGERWEFLPARRPAPPAPAAGSGGRARLAGDRTRGEDGETGAGLVLLTAQLEQIRGESLLR